MYPQCRMQLAKPGGFVSCPVTAFSHSERWKSCWSSRSHVGRCFDHPPLHQGTNPRTPSHPYLLPLQVVASMVSALAQLDSGQSDWSSKGSRTRGASTRQPHQDQLHISSGMSCPVPCEPAPPLRFQLANSLTFSLEMSRVPKTCKWSEPFWAQSTCNGYASPERLYTVEWFAQHCQATRWTLQSLSAQSLRLLRL